MRAHLEYIAHNFGPLIEGPTEAQSQVMPPADSLPNKLEQPP